MQQGNPPPIVPLRPDRPQSAAARTGSSVGADHERAGPSHSGRVRKRERDRLSKIAQKAEQHRRQEHTSSSGYSACSRAALPR